VPSKPDILRQIRRQKEKKQRSLETTRKAKYENAWGKAQGRAGSGPNTDSSLLEGGDPWEKKRNFAGRGQGRAIV